MYNYFAVTARGLEHLLEQELLTLGAINTKTTVAGVFFQGELETAYQCCLWSRLASRIIWVLREFTVNSDLDLYSGVIAENWPEHFDESRSIIIDFNGTNEEIRHSQYGALKVKDAIMDRFDRASLERPSIEKESPDLRIHVRLVKKHAILGIDLVTEGLHQRGYRLQAGQAPLRETNAVALVLKSGWTTGTSLFDPMCGSGTLLIEAAMIAASIAPGLKRTQWGFMALSNYDPLIWNSLYQAALNGVQTDPSTQLIGYDQDPMVIAIAKENAKRAGVDHMIQFKQQDLYQLTEKPVGFDTGIILSNPPYGERLGNHAQLQLLYQTLGQVCKSLFPGSSAAFYSSSDDLLSCIGMRSHKQFSLKNGSLDCRLKCYTILARAESSINPLQDQIEKSVEESTPLSSLTVAIDFANRLTKNIKKLEKWAKQNQITCYRLYDADIPNYNAAIDLYQTIAGESYLLIQEYAAPKEMPEKVAHQRLLDLMRATVYVTKIKPEHVILKTRRQQKGKEQYQRLQQRNQFLQINEFGLIFQVNLNDYLDTGIFLDHRFTRKMIGEMAKGKHVLNLFSYTGTATIHAAMAGAKTTTTVDMSNTYLNWAKENMRLNKLNSNTDKHQFIQADCIQWLVEQTQLPEHKLQGFDLIFIDPPTFSNSKRMSDHFDVQADHLELLKLASELLMPNGVILFSNNKQHFKMDIEGLATIGLSAQNITSKTIPIDFAHHQQIHNSWLLTEQRS